MAALLTPARAPAVMVTPINDKIAGEMTMISKFVDFNTAQTEPVIFETAPEEIVAGNPSWRVWRHVDGPIIRAGVFESTPGSWTFRMQVWEYVIVLAGKCIVHHEDGTSSAFGPGDSFVLEPGYSGTMEVVETVTEQFMMRLE